MATKSKAPYLQRAGKSWELIVDGHPYLILGAELQNSSMSSSRYMEDVWPNLVKMGINTVLGPVTWEDIEPQEGTFDFSRLDAAMEGARSHNLRLVLLWFGSFKNGRSSYAPKWVKKDQKRFPRMYVHGTDGKLENSGVLSVFHRECYEADAKAFSKLMEHFSHMDDRHTVLMMQVENEVGLHRDSRDRSTIANSAFDSAVPNSLIELLHNEWHHLHPDLKSNFPNFQQTYKRLTTEGGAHSWRDWFGESIYTDELFMSYHYANYLEKVSSAGRREYDIPLYTNVWLAEPGEPGSAAGGDKPGVYPSGGGVSQVLDIWQKFAPTLDFIAPDNYQTYYETACANYTHRGQPLFIPEQRRNDFGARTVWSAIGTFRALGACPFGIDTQTPEEAPIASHYGLLGSVSQHILNARRNDLSMVGFCFHDFAKDGTDPSPPFTSTMKEYNLRISRAFVLGKEAPGYGIIIELEPDKFLLVGKGFKVEWSSKSPKHSYTEIIAFEEKAPAGDQAQSLETNRILNGDESGSGSFANMPNDDPDHGDAFVPIIIPARTGIAEVTVHSLSNELGQ
ncbi:glycoside hydrolase family 35 [Fusarium pseudocircinatum]|uniref:Glycoside hydrolase family 35 n=1 Tax=Fusarium pseudocircinatum TaxID=56676 RepID=A0A8H5KIR9_9HYPO|nr:glycoside hydrolase family 35 [Fusarium pseudocircinatum]